MKTEKTNSLKYIFSFCLLLMLLVSGCAPVKSVMASVPEPAAWPTAGWQRSTPEAQGMDSTLLASMLEDLAANHTNLYSVQVVRNGMVVAEAYMHPYTGDTRVHVQSITKSVIGMLAGRAIALGLLKGEDESLASFFPGRVFANDSPEKQSIRLSHLLSMTSGLDCQEFTTTGPKMEQSSGWVQFMLDLPVTSKPGTKFNYCNGNAHLLSAILEKVTGMTAREFANRELFAPLGIPAVDAADWGADPKGYSIGGYGLHLTPADLAKLALLSLQDGRWEGRQLLPAGWVGKSTTRWIDKGDGSGYGYMWTVYPKLGRYAALGLGGQQIHVYPAKNLIVVVTAGLPAYTEAPEVEKMLAEYILPAVKSDRTLAENPEGVARLQAAVEQAANPIRPMGDLPTVALDISGSTYTFDENPYGWQTLQLVFAQGADAARLAFNGTTGIQIGLDNLYRLSDTTVLGKLLMRGRWIDGQTFAVDYPYNMAGPLRLGELGETEMRFQFTGDQVRMTATPLIFGGEPLVLTGKR
ncbi:MAG TPA: serine hydrolase [Anaerolinea sp.]|nr:serine hydrolase [Anaerolinea sp.]